MDSQLVICLILFVLTCIGYITNIWSLGTTALVSLVALSLTGCLTPAEALGYFSNNTVIMIAAMSVVAAGFNRTRFCTELANGISKMAKGSKDAKAAAEIMQQLLAALNDGKPASTFALPENEAFLQSWRELGLLTAKPVIYCANVDENAVADGNELSQRVQALAAERNAGFARICAKLEEELQGLPDEEQAEMLSSYGIDESGLVRIIRTGYDTLGLCSYFTAGPDEVRAWTIRKGWKAPQAAGVIHTDFERGFIRAEVISYDDYMSHESEAACRADGVLRVEGKEYVVQDGDVMHFLFNV